MLIPDAIHLQMIRSTGGEVIAHARGTFLALFDNEYITVDTDGVPVEQRTPILTVRTQDVADIAKDTRLQRPNGDGYRVIRMEPDGVGETRIILTKD